MFDGKEYELFSVYNNYGGDKGHKIALGEAENERDKGNYARVEAHSGFTAGYVRTK